MKPIYLDRHGNSQKNTGTIESPVMVDLVKEDIGIASCGVEYDKNGISYRVIFIGQNTNAFTEDYKTNFVEQIKDSNGVWNDLKVWAPIAPNPEHHRYNNPQEENFGGFEPNPLDENGDLKPDLVNEVQFFQINVGCASNNVPIALYDVFIDSILYKLQNELT